MNKLTFFHVSTLSVFSLIVSALAQNTINDPIRPTTLQLFKTVNNVTNNATIVYPSEDTNRNRKPTHVSEEINSYYALAS